MELLKRENLRLFFAKVHHRSSKGQPLSFENRHYLEGIYEDQSQYIVIKKATQMGITEFLLCDSFANADKKITTFYVLPTQVVRGRVVKDRIDNMSLFSPYYSKKLREIPKAEASVTMKRFGQGLMVFVGSNAKSEFIAVPADSVVIDEYNDCHQEHLGLAFTRLDASEHKFRRIVGVPTYDNVGIDMEYGNSDMKKWQIRCDHCGRFQALDFFKNIVQETSENQFELLDKDWTPDSKEDIKVFCKYCSKPIDRLKKGEWIAENPQSPVSGYEVTQLYSPTKTIAEIWDSFEKAFLDQTKMQIFYNTSLGLAYTASGVKITKTILDNCKGDYLMPSSAKKSVMGVDVGKVLDVWILEMKGDKPKTVFIGSVKEFEDLDILIKQFGVKCAVVDSLPETHKVKEFQKKYSMAWLCNYYPTDKIADMQKDDQRRLVTVDRTQSLDALMKDILDVAFLVPKNLDSLEGGEVLSQLTASIRKFDERKQKYVWDEGVRKDHKHHAANYARIAWQLFKTPVQIYI